MHRRFGLALATPLLYQNSFALASVPCCMDDCAGPAPPSCCSLWSVRITCASRSTPSPSKTHPASVSTVENQVCANALCPKDYRRRHMQYRLRRNAAVAPRHGGFLPDIIFKMGTSVLCVTGNLKDLALYETVSVAGLHSENFAPAQQQRFPLLSRVAQRRRSQSRMAASAR
jgi:hypothetical protein